MIVVYIIPSVDIKDGKCVKLVQGKLGSGRTISEDPVSVAIWWENEGAKILHVVDLDGAFSGERTNWNIVFKILNSVAVPVEVGGGIRSVDDAQSMLGAGARWIIVGTAAVEDPRALSDMFSLLGPSKIIIAIDSRGGKVLRHGWTVEGAESALELVEKFQGLTPAALLYTDVEVEGRQAGVDMETVKKLVSAAKIPVIYSGGIASLQDLVSLARIGVYGAVVGSALYQEKFTLREAEQAVEKANV